MLIDSDSLLKKFESGALLFQPDVRKVIESEPESVVRCGDCKYYKDHHCTYIYQISIPHSPGFYCAWGERKSLEDPSHPCADSVMMGD